MSHTHISHDYEALEVPAIEVPLETPTQRATVAPGVAERLTFRCYFDFDELDQPLALARNWPSRSVVTREFGYRLLRLLETFRYRLRSDEVESEWFVRSGARRLYRSLLQ